MSISKLKITLCIASIVICLIILAATKPVVKNNIVKLRSVPTLAGQLSINSPTIIPYSQRVLTIHAGTTNMLAPPKEATIDNPKALKAAPITNETIAAANSNQIDSSGTHPIRCHDQAEQAMRDCAPAACQTNAGSCPDCNSSKSCDAK